MCWNHNAQAEPPLLMSTRQPICSSSASIANMPVSTATGSNEGAGASERVIFQFEHLTSGCGVIPQTQARRRRVPARNSISNSSISQQVCWYHQTQTQTRVWLFSPGNSLLDMPVSPNPGSRSWACASERVCFQFRVLTYRSANLSIHGIIRKGSAGERARFRLS